MSVQILALSYTKKFPQCWVMPIVISGAVLTVLVVQSCKVLLHAIFSAPRTRGTLFWYTTSTHIHTARQQGWIKALLTKKAQNQRETLMKLSVTTFPLQLFTTHFCFIKRHDAPLISLHAVTVHDFFTHVCVNDTPLQAFYSRDKSRYSLLVWLWTPDSLMCSR